jgi:rhodanese-related sulfurtransferase
MCSSGQLSCKAAALLEAAGFTHVYNVLGGYADFRGQLRSELRNAVHREPSPT